MWPNFHIGTSLAVCICIFHLSSAFLSFSSNTLDDDDDDSPVIFNYNKYLQRPHSMQIDSKSKVETLGAVLKGHIQNLKKTANKEVDLIFLVDSSTSVGKSNFKEEIKFVKKLLSDFTVDVNQTRVAVVTFSSRERVIRHVDYFSHTRKDRHKCALLEEGLRRITYTGGGTYTLGAFREAKKVLKHARPTASKAIFLITDGFSNGGDPRPEARKLRQKGVKIFTFGIQNGNVRELFDMSSEPKNESCYILDSFEEFEALARRALHEDLSSGVYIPQPNRKCNRLCVGRGCCAKTASCNCGTHTGKYECLCPPGFYGNGLRGGCQACPSGTYKPEPQPGDVYTCLKCPDENHKSDPGSTSEHQCVCRKGYRAFNGTGCVVLTCPALRVPKNGYFINDRCKNVFNAACGLRCKPGFELRGSSLRICREDGSWSGTETQCIMKTCPTLMTPKNGNMICTTDDFTFDTVCRFTCDTGYKLVGSRKRSCLAIAFWTGINTRCREITCQPLPVVRDGNIYPPACTAGDVAFGTTCSITCHSGYTLIGPHNKQCLPVGVWAPPSEVIQCVDTTPPFIMCPYNIEVNTDYNENTAMVSWEVPLAVDNSGYVPILSSDPAVMPPSRFVLGKTKVTYVAEDLNKNKADCQFYVHVKDKQKPTLDRCFAPLPIVSSEPYAEVEWEEPLFSDNSGLEPRIQRSHAPGLFPMGITEVTYKAYDQSGNNNTCTLKINIIPHPCEYPPIPLNGNRTCFEDTNGIVCTFFCKPGHEFAIQPAKQYVCEFDNVWKPRDQMPVSDCSARQLSKHITHAASFTFAGLVACQSRVDLTRLEKDFERRVNKRINELCEEGVTCGISDLETTCQLPEDEDAVIVLGREKRSVSDQDRRTDSLPAEKAIITFSYVLTGSVDESSNSDEKQIADYQRKLLNSMENIKTTLKKDAKKGQLDLQANGEKLVLSDMTFSEHPTYNCEEGSVVVHNGCVDCPVGTFYNIVEHQCESCPIGTFQPSKGQVSCLFCPTNTSTPGAHATSEDECKALCLPGTFSVNGLEFCETCRKGYYLSEYGQTSCHKCPKRRTTLRRGTSIQEDCIEKCDPGTVSRTGLQPCWPCPRGTYQPKGGKSSCTWCPGKADTAGTRSTNINQCELQLADSPLNQQPFDPLAGQQVEELPADECFDAPCQNGATCVAEFFGFNCQCTDGYTGVFCAEEVDECALNPCLNGATCRDLLADYACLCTDGFEGKKCEIDIDDCAEGPCLNGATCVDQVNAFACSCINGYEGGKCEVNIDDCAADSCLNGGTCVDEVAGFRCICPEGISGENCEIDEDNCASGPCLNNGNCIDGPGSFTCECLAGFSGTTCETDIDECADSPCADGARCEDLIGTYKCHCPRGFAGDDCTEEIDAYFQMDFPSTATKMDYAKADISNDLTSATVCFWMKSDDSTNQGTPFSYATADEFNSFTLSDYDGFAFFVNGEKVTTAVKANDGQWHHICVLWSSNRGTWKIYMDGAPEDSGRNLASGAVIKGGGVFVIGQEQDSLGGGFSSPETFIGKITQLNVWGQELSLRQIEALRQSCEKQLGDVIAWTDVSGKGQGAVSDSKIDFCKVCPEPTQIDNGDVTHNGVTAGSRATYTCNRGFNLAGLNEHLCLVTGEWEGRTPTCQGVQCPYPGLIENGWIEGDRFTFDNRIRYLCKKGFMLVGSSTRYCGEFGFWVEDAPVCERIKCVVPALSENTILMNPPPDKKFEVGTDAYFTCTEGNKFYSDHSDVYCQRDGTWDKSIPTCDPQKCQQPPSIEDGFHNNRDASNEYTVGFGATYECEFGFTFSKNSLNPLGRIACLASGEWEANLPQCVVVQCSQPPSIVNGQVTTDGLEFLSRATYTCNTGYELTDDEIVVECLEAGLWVPDPPECIPVRCGRPDDVLHGSFTGDEYTYTATVTYSCNLGYIMLGEAELRCQADASWSLDAPTCKPVSCGKPGDIENGSVIGRDYTLNNIVRYVCNAGFDLVGSVERACRETGKWQNDAPSCIRVECDYPPAVSNGFFSETSFLYEDTITYQCDEGFYLDGDDTLTCQSTKQWAPAAPTCNPIQCSLPPSVDRAVVSNAENLISFSIGFRIQYQCETGYEISLNSLNPSGQVECLGTGQWENNPPECLIVECRRPLPVQHGSFQVTGLTYLSEATYECNEGYDPVGLSIRTCQANGTWQGEAAVCNPIKCLAPIFVDHGRVDYKDLTLGSVVRYMCDSGYELTNGPEVRRCLANLTWSGVEPVCQAVSCPEPVDIEHGTKQIAGLTFQSSVTYSCDTGYLMIGNGVLTCTSDKTWSDAVPVCEIVQCDKPSRVTSNGRMIGEVFSYGSVIEYECDPGYDIDGTSNERRCLDSGQWDSPIPICTVVECPRLFMRHGSISSFQREFGTTVALECNPGYRLVGAASRTCELSGFWSGEETTCVKYACPTLDVPVNGQMFIRGGTTASYVCFKGFILNGPSTRTCQEDDTWTGTDPTCDPVPCTDITTTDFLNGFRTVDGLVFGSSIVYECNAGFILAGERRLDCLDDGMWSGVEPVCNKRICFPPFTPHHSIIIGDDHTFNSTITYTCDEGYEVVGSEERVCLADGSWSGDAPSCLLIVCPIPEPNINVIVSGTSNSYNSVRDYACNSGFRLVGSKQRRCTESKVWSGEEPTCVRTDCEEPAPLDNGIIHRTSFTPGSRIIYECNEGFTLEGIGIRLCLGTATWSGDAPHCQKVKCPTPPPLLNGYFIGFERFFGDLVEYRCDSGYELVGDATRTCLSVGQWGGADPACIKIKCPPPVLPDHVVYTLPKGSDSGSYEIMANLSCDEGYSGEGYLQVECQANGSWTETNFQCNIVECPAFTSIENGQVRGSSFTYDSEIEVQCDTGFRSAGKSRFKCLPSGQWDYENEPRCEQIFCPALADIANGRVDVSGSLVVDSTARYACNEGYRSQGSDTRTCQANGSWTETNFVCNIVECPAFTSIDNGQVHGSSFTYESEIEVQCDEGFRSAGKSRFKCLPSGQWDYENEPRCEQIFCPELQGIVNGYVNVSGAPAVGATAKYTCNEGYRSQGVDTRTCQVDGSWTETNFQCDIVECPAFSSITNGQVLGSTFTYDSEIEVQCDSGFRSAAKSRFKCLPSGDWDYEYETRPRCEQIFCPALIDIANGRVDVSGSLVVGSTARYTCNEGYRSQGSDTRTCQADGSWTETNFQCIIVECPAFSSITNGQVRGLTFTYDSEIEIVCDEGYYIEGKSRFKCLPSGQWDYENEPRCEQKFCPELLGISNGRVVISGKPVVGSAAMYKCNEGYRMQGLDTRICQTDGQWSSSDPYCGLIICNTPVSVPNARPFDSTIRYLHNHKARYACDTGYAKSTGDDFLRCSEYGNWTGTVPVCSIILCPSPTAVQNSQVNSPLLEYNSVAEYICEEGHGLKGSSTVRCGEDGEWVGALPSCFPINCGAPPKVKNSVEVGSTEYTYKSFVTYICEAGYRLVGAQSATCLATGVWSGPPPVCEPISCGPPPKIPNANRKGDRQVYKSKVTYSCFDGFEMTGNNTLECSYNGAWMSERPACRKISCGPPPVLPHASTTLPSGETINSTALFRCNEGYYLIGSTYATCTSSRRWVYDSPPSCYPVDCGVPPTITNGVPQYTYTTFNTEVTYACNAGYYLASESSLRCAAGEIWEGHVPTCEPVNCGEPPWNDHVVVIGSVFSYQSTVDYKCLPGYNIAGSTSVACTATGAWSGPAPLCQRVTCKPLTLPENGIKLAGDIASDMYYGDRVVLGCADGYTIVGSSELHCLETGSWSNHLPKCIASVAIGTCEGDSGVVHAGHVTTPVPIGSDVTLQCDTGYRASGPLQVTCQKDLSWSNPRGRCSKVFCGKPTLRDFVNVVRIRGASYFYGDQIHFRCRAGVAPARSPPTITCLADGNWDGSIACGVTCKRPCQNGGICLGLNRCKCPTGYGGRVCEKANCILPCLNGGKCAAPYKCSCPHGYGGVRCNKAICNKKCVNGGRCLKPNKCKCKHGYKGAFCEQKRG